MQICFKLVKHTCEINVYNLCSQSGTISILSKVTVCTTPFLVCNIYQNGQVNILHKNILAHHAGQCDLSRKEILTLFLSIKLDYSQSVVRCHPYQTSTMIVSPPPKKTLKRRAFGSPAMMWRHDAFASGRKCDVSVEKR